MLLFVVWVAPEGMNSELQLSYDQLYQTAWQKIAAAEEEVDPQIDMKPSQDTRYGFSLVIRPAPSIFASIEGFYSLLRVIEPDQYYYPTVDLHVTLLSILSCTEGFQLSHIDTQAYIDIIASCLKEIPRFSIHFRGVTMSSSCIMLRGFPDSTALNLARDKVRAAITASGLQHSMDQRYPQKLAHSTVVRFRKGLQNRMELLRILDAYRDFDFGSVVVDAVHAIGNDWYVKQRRLQVVQILPLE